MTSATFHLHQQENTNFSKAAFSKKRQEVEVRKPNDILVDDIWCLHRNAMLFCKRDRLHTNTYTQTMQ